MSNRSQAQSEAKKRYREKNKELIAAKAREKYRENPSSKKKSPKGYSRKYHYPRKYGISLEQYGKMVIAQDNKCAICNQEESIKDTRLCVDHDHRTGEVRELLCRACNAALGKFKDSVEILDRAKSYLLRHGKENGINPT